MSREKIRIYPKVYRRDNDSKQKWRPEVYKEKRFLIQEKLDGSNVTFGIHNGEFKVYSRTQEITMDETFGKTQLTEFTKYERTIREIAEDNGYKTFLISGELLGQAKLGYNSTCSGKLGDSFYVFDIQYSKEEGLATKLREQGMMEFMDWTMLNVHCISLELNIIPLIDTMTYDYWEKNKDSLYGTFVQDRDKVYQSLIDNKVAREGVVVKIEGTGMRYKIVSSAFAEKVYKKGSNDENKPIPKRLLDIFATEGRIEKILQKLQLEGEFDGDRKNKRNYKTMLGSGSKALVEDIIEEEIMDIIEMVRKGMRRMASVKIKDYIESDGLRCECCEKDIKHSELHPEKRTCPHCGLYALKRKVMKFDEERNENYLYDQVTGERFSAVDGKKHKFKEEGI